MTVTWPRCKQKKVNDKTEKISYIIRFTVSKFHEYPDIRSMSDSKKSPSLSLAILRYSFLCQSIVDFLLNADFANFDSNNK